MAAAGRRPFRKTASTAAGTSAINHDFTVPANKVWEISLIVIEFGTAAAGNTTDIQEDTTASFVNAFDQMSNFLRLPVDPHAFYGRGLVLEAADVLRCAYTRGTSSTIATTVYGHERDS